MLAFFGGPYGSILSIVVFILLVAVVLYTAREIWDDLWEDPRNWPQIAFKGVILLAAAFFLTRRVLIWTSVI
jgi:hypothetical protein